MPGNSAGVYTKTFTDDQNNEVSETNTSAEEETYKEDNLFDQDMDEDEDFEIPAFLKTKVLMIKYSINENSKLITGIIPFSSDVE